MKLCIQFIKHEYINKTIFCVQQMFNFSNNPQFQNINKHLKFWSHIKLTTSHQLVQLSAISVCDFYIFLTPYSIRIKEYRPG